MKTPDDVAEMLRLKRAGGAKVDRAPAGLQPSYGEGLCGIGWREAVPPAAATEKARRSPRVAERAV